MPTVTIREATVQTMQVEIKALKVGKKQVTMGLFRQLPLAPLIDPETVQLHGIPWGHVLYWWDGAGIARQGGAEDYLHMVWQDGDTLRRAIVSLEPPSHIMHNFESTERIYQKHFFCLKLLEDPAVRVEVPAYTWGGVWADIVWQAHKVRLFFADEEERAIVAEFSGQRHYEPFRKSYIELLEGLQIVNTTPEEWNERLAALDMIRTQYVVRWKKQIAALLELPQLFIAV